MERFELLSCSLIACYRLCRHLSFRFEVFSLSSALRAKERQAVLLWISRSDFERTLGSLKENLGLKARGFVSRLKKFQPESRFLRDTSRHVNLKTCEVGQERCAQHTLHGAKPRLLLRNAAFRPASRALKQAQRCRQTESCFPSPERGSPKSLRSRSWPRPRLWSRSLDCQAPRGLPFPSSDRALLC